MNKRNAPTSFTARLLRPASGDGGFVAFVVLPKNVSDKLPRRGRTTVEGQINGHPFQATLEPDGKRSHWLKVDADLLAQSGIGIGDIVTLEISPVAQEPEPDVPADLQQALSATPEAYATWKGTTTLARLDWIHWITSAKQARTRTKRISDACNMLAEGKRNVCCSDPSGFYSKALSAPKEAD